jgi:hypothetical protein
MMLLPLRDNLTGRGQFPSQIEEDQIGEDCG